MSHLEARNPFDRVRVIQDERERIIVLSDFELELPAVGIFDEPTRCYKVNKEWAKIITGAIDLLTEIAVWKNAENEGYTGIQQIIRYLQGEDCMDCNDIENCLENSATIAAINSAIADLSVYDANLLSLIQDNQSAITTNANNISSLQTDVNQILTVDLPQIALTTADLQTQITNNDNELADHETRITTLENSSGGGGSYPSRTVRLEETIDYYVVPANTQDVFYLCDIPGAYDEIRIDFLIRDNNGAFNRMNLFVNDDEVNTNYQSDTGGVEWDAPYILQWDLNNIPDNFIAGKIIIPFPSTDYYQTAYSDGVSAATIDNFVSLSTYSWFHKVVGAITRIKLSTTVSGFEAGSTFRVVGIKETDVLVPNTAPTYLSLVDFSANSDPYTIESGTVESVGGNPDECLETVNANYGTVAAQADLAQAEDITFIHFELYMNNGYTNNVEFRIYDGLGNLLTSDTLVVTQDTWQEVNYYPTNLNTNGILIRVYGDGGGSSHTLRLDNIIVN